MRSYAVIYPWVQLRNYQVETQFLIFLKIYFKKYFQKMFKQTFKN